MTHRTGTIAGLLAALILMPVPSPATASRLIEAVRVHRVDVQPTGGDNDPLLVAMLATDDTDTPQLRLRSINRNDGFQTGSDAVLPYLEQDGFVATDVRISSVISPGNVLVLGANGTIRIITIKLDDDGTPLPVDEISLNFAFGDGSVRMLRLAEMPALTDGRPLLAAGTDSGEVILGVADSHDRTTQDGATVFEDEMTRVALEAGSLPIDDLEAIPQPDGMAFVAVTDGGLVLVRPDTDSRTPGLQPQVTGRLPDPRRLDDPSVPPIIDLSWGESNIGIVSTEPVTIVTANGTAELATYELRSGFDPQTDELTLKNFDPVCVPVRQVVAGSLTLLSDDGSGVGYDRRFTPTNPTLGTIWTIAGARADIDPDRTPPTTRGRWVTARIEVASGGATHIQPTSVVLDVAGTTLPALQHPAPAIVLTDGDANPELEVKLDPQQILDAIDGRSGEIPVTLRWRYRDGVAGRAQTVLRR